MSPDFLLDLPSIKLLLRAAEKTFWLSYEKISIQIIRINVYNFTELQTEAERSYL